MSGLSFLSKKSWHTTNVRNVEKVYLEEQRKAREDEKLAELRKQLDEERELEEMQELQEKSGLIVREKKSKEKLNWMYQGPQAIKPSDEDYVLGNAEKDLDNEQEKKAQQALKDNSSAPGSLFLNNKASDPNEAFTRMHEDPLFAIQRKAAEARKNVRSNPIQMKLARERAREHSRREDSSRKKKKEKKKRKHRRRARSSSENSDDSRDRRRTEDTRRRRRRSRSRSVEDTQDRRRTGDTRGRQRRSSSVDDTRDRRRKEKSRRLSEDSDTRDRKNTHKRTSRRRSSSEDSYDRKHSKRTHKRKRKLEVSRRSRSPRETSRSMDRRQDPAKRSVENKGPQKVEGYGLQLTRPSTVPRPVDDSLGPSADMIEKRKGYIEEQRAKQNKFYGSSYKGGKRNVAVIKDRAKVLEEMTKDGQARSSEQESLRQVDRQRKLKELQAVEQVGKSLDDVDRPSFLNENVDADRTLEERIRSKRFTRQRLDSD
mmetsp:Transcript_10490/g.22793  ORF Transcript_10490/g.22793 Transcript_10490/m.22793 type:complete len:484 (+) Transcript_10490:51-1502(+)